MTSIHTQGVSKNRVRRCLEYSILSYQSYQSVEAALHKDGMKLLAWYDEEDTQAFLASGYGDLYLTFRGTESFRDWLTDFNYVKTDFSCGGRGHLGFEKAFLAVEPYITSDLKNLPPWPLVVAGHSLGAALAQIAGVKYKAAEGVVWGSPRVGNSTFTKLINYPLTRFEHWNDPVTYIPPINSPRQALYALWKRRWPTFYRHGGVRVGLGGHLHRMVHYRPSTEAWLATQT